MTLTSTQHQFLRALYNQEQAARAQPGVYSTGLTAGGQGCYRRSTAMACLDRGLVDVRRAGGMVTYELTAAGRAAAQQ